MLARPRILLTLQQWQRIEPHICGRRQDPGVTGANNRRFVEGVFWILRTGAPWRDLPRYFGRWNSIYQRFRRWCIRGVWGRILRHVTPHTVEDSLLVDSTIVRAHQHSTNGRGALARRAIGRSRGGLTTKLHVAVTPGWRLQAHVITAGHRADIMSAARLVHAVNHSVAVVGDRGYDSDRFVEHVTARGCVAVIPPRRHRRKPRPWSRHLYRQRHRVENYFARLKHFRRIATRFDKRVPTWRGFFFAANIAMQVGATVPVQKRAPEPQRRIG